MKGGYLMSITKHNLSFLDYIQLSYLNMFLSGLGFITLITLIILLFIFIKKRKNINDPILKFKFILIIIMCLFILSIIVFASIIPDCSSYYSINGKTKVTNVKSYSTNGNIFDNNTQTIYFIYNDHIYNIESPDNKVIEKGDIIQFKSSKYATNIYNGTISEANNLAKQSLDIKVIHQ